MSSEDDMIIEAVSKLGDEISPNIKKAIEGVTENVVKGGMAPKDAMGLDEAAIEGIYGHAYRLYNAGKYKDSQLLFRLLITLDPMESKFMMGSAACFHMLQEFSHAASLYAIASMINQENPIPHYHSADCYAKMGLNGAAMNELMLTIVLCGEAPQYAVIKDRSGLMLEQIGKQEGIEGKVKAKSQDSAAETKEEEPSNEEG